jgi:hypothetical protein
LLVLLIFYVVLKKWSTSANTIDHFQGVNESGITPNTGLNITGTSDEIADLNTYSARITSLEKRVTAIESQIKNFHDNVTAPPSATSATSSTSS